MRAVGRRGGAGAHRGAAGVADAGVGGGHADGDDEEEPVRGRGRSRRRVIVDSEDEQEGDASASGAGHGEGPSLQASVDALLQNQPILARGGSRFVPFHPHRRVVASDGGGDLEHIDQ